MGTGASTKSNAIEKVLFDDAVADENSKNSDKYLEDNAFLKKMNMAGLRRARVEKQGKALVGALAARQKIIKKAAELKAKRQLLANRYDENLKDNKLIITINHDYTLVVPHIYVVKIPKLKNRNTLREALLEFGIETGVHWKPNHLLSMYKKNMELLMLLK